MTPPPSSPAADAPVGVSVIVPTTCDSSRAELLWRALESVSAQQGVDLELIVVANGGGVDEALYRQLEGRPSVNVTRQAAGSLPAAQRRGRELVSRETFLLLDDDDELLPGALSTRASALFGADQPDAVVTNGFITYDGQVDELCRSGFESVRPDPLTALLRENWLVSGSALFRTDAIPLDYFDGETKYREWTLLAIRILLGGGRFGFIDDVTFRKHEEVPGSLSKSAAYRNASIEFLEHLLTLELPRRARSEVRRKLSRALHTRSVQCRQSGDIGGAWRAHLRSLGPPYGLRYVAYTRRLIAAALLSGAGRQSRTR